jgi:hypothetical protein
MRTIAFATPLSLHEENSRTMLPRFTALANWGRGMLSRWDRLFRKTTEQGAVAQHCPHCPHCLARASKQSDDRPVASTGKLESVSQPEFIRTQSQLMETMLKSMIVASGWNVDGSARRDRLKD